MTKIVKKIIKCANCGTESEQFIIHSINFMLGKKEDNLNLMKNQQTCPKCNYTNFDISILSNNK